MALSNGNTETQEQTWIDANIAAVAQGVGIYGVTFTCVLDSGRSFNNPNVTVNSSAKTATITMGIGTKSRGHWVNYLKKRMVEVAKDLGIKQTIPTRIFAPAPLSVVETTPANWNLVFEDQFLNLNNWQWKMDWSSNAKVNSEEQGYPDSWRNVHLIPGGGVIITAKRESFVGMDGATSEFSSGMLASYPAYVFNQGYFEARYKAPPGQGMHVGFWLYDANSGANTSQEHDIAEHIGQLPWGVSHGEFLPSGAEVAVDMDYGSGDLTDGMHVYGYEWDGTNLKRYVDNVLISTHSASGMTHDCYLVFTFALGSTFSGPVGHLEQFPKEMVIDYVKVWERA